MSESPAVGQDCKENKIEKNSGDVQDGPARVLKRPREEDDDSVNRTTTEDAEPEEKRPSFKLNPPTLIHGQAKPAPKETTQETAPKKIFLRPSILSAPSTVTQTITPSAPSTNGNPVPSITQAPSLGSGLVLPGQVSSNNPFLKTAEEEEEKVEPVSQTTFGAQALQNDTAADSSSEATKVNGGNENPFLQTKSSADAEEASAEDTGGGFVFGRKMEERVVKNEADSTSGTGTSDSVSNKAESDDFVFGKNLSDRVKVTAATVDSTNTALPTAPAESSLFQTSNVSDGVSSSTSGRLEENAAALFSASNTKVIMPEVEVKTGEEDEKNVLQIQCKLYQYDSSNSKNWVERGRGNLRLNDKRVSTPDKFQSRLVMRTHGSLRLILNTKIWETMVVEKANSKSVRISAQNEEGDIGVYLIQGTINDADHIYRAIEYRVLHLKQLQQKQDAQSWDNSGNTKSEEPSVSSTVSADSKTKAFDDSPEVHSEIQVSSSDATPESDGTTTTIKSTGQEEEEKEAEPAVSVIKNTSNEDTSESCATETKKSETTVVEEASSSAADENSKESNPETNDKN